MTPEQSAESSPGNSVTPPSPARSPENSPEPVSVTQSSPADSDEAAGLFSSRLSSGGPTSHHSVQPGGLSGQALIAIELDHVSKVFGGVVVLRDICARFHPGRIYAIVGGNGAGKSTLLRLIAGLSQPTRGTISIGKPSPSGAGQGDTGRRHLGFMSHESFLYDEMSAMENLGYFYALYGLEARRRDAECALALTSVGLDPGLRRRIAHYSQGMRQRLSLARALIHQPRILLLDEPFSNLDAASTAQITRLLAGMRDAGKTMLVVTHQAALLEGVADDFISLAAGRLGRPAATA